MQAELLIERIKELPPEKIAEVEDFVEFLWRRTARPEQTVEEEERASELQAIAASMKANAFTGNPPTPLTRTYWSMRMIRATRLREVLKPCLCNQRHTRGTP